MINRRGFLHSFAALAAALPFRRALSQSPPSSTGLRLISDNDYAGDPDGLFQLAHHLLCPSVDMRLVIGSHLHEHEAWSDAPDQAAGAAAKATELMQLLGQAGRVPVLAGAEHALQGTQLPVMTPAAEAIIREALRTDVHTPLYYTAGAGLTDLATAWLLEPRIGRRLTLVWIGGPEYPGTPAPPGPREAEYNTSIDLRAAQVVFNRSDINVWQVPRNTYRQMIVGYAELLARVGGAGRVGEYLVGNIDRVRKAVASMPADRGLAVGDTYVLGDSPLVTLTALQTPFQPDAASCQYVARARPTIDHAGYYGKPSGGRPIRVYTRIDTRLTFEDLYARLAANARG